MVEMQFVQSNTVEAIGYDAQSSELVIQFKSSPSPYIYQGVPEHVYEGLMASSTKGGFLHREVISVYPFYRG